MIRTLLAGTVLAAAGAGAQAPEAPCAALRTPALPPCEAPTSAPSPVLATVDGDAIRTADLAPELRKRIDGVEMAVARARREALEAEIADVRLHLEAGRRGVPFRDFWEAEILRKTPPASDAELAAEYERAKAWFPGKSLEDLRPRLASVVLAAHRARREADVAASLGDRFPAAAGADPGAPALPPDAVLATVGGRTITAASASTRLDAAAFAVRRELHYDVLDALEKAAAARLLKAEAERRGTTPEEILEEDRGALTKITSGKRLSVHVEPPLPPALSFDVAGAASRGPGAARVTVVEYADFECPHCAKGWEAAEEALRPYGDSVRYVFRDFPLPFHAHALAAAEAARAAGAQGRYFEMAALLFANQGALDAASLKAYAARAGCDAARFAADLDSGRYEADVLLEARGGERVGVNGTPMFFVNGVWLRWEAADVKGIRAAVDAALAKTAAPSPAVAGAAAASVAARP